MSKCEYCISMSTITFEMRIGFKRTKLAIWIKCIGKSPSNLDIFQVDSEFISEKFDLQY